MMRFSDLLRTGCLRGRHVLCLMRGVAAALAAAVLGLALLAQPAFAQAPPASGPVVNVYNWTDYIDPSVLDAFTRETGIRVVYDMYDNNEIVETKLLAGKSGYDVVVPSGPFLSRLVRAGLFLKLDRSKLPNVRHIWPDIAAQLARHDPGNQFAVNYMWGTTGIGLNVAKVRERLGPSAALNSWDLLLKPEVSAKLKDCGIHVLDAPEDILPGVLRYLGLNPDSKNEADLRKAADALARVRGNIRTFHSSEYLNALASGEICMAVGYSGDVLQARRRAEEARNGVDIQFIVPREGAQMWFDSMAIPADAANPAEAHAFIDFMLRPDVAARNSNLVSYASGNLAARDLVRPEIRGNPGIYPDQATFARLFTTTAYDERLQRAVARLWTRVKTGR
ncbi:MAG: polyamine ABC transporter substrate-binding protein [Beijerinckiaceae bacterium]|nr:polyamine ABC transporter substrate-binding protein [Beijerinckiaceae bacterium]